MTYTEEQENQLVHEKKHYYKVKNYVDIGRGKYRLRLSSEQMIISQK